MNKISKILLAVFTMLVPQIISASEDELLVFIGTYVDVKEWPYSEEYLAECNCVVMDLRFKAKYEVKKVLYGEYLEQEITFTVHDHYGFPEFAKQKSSIIYLVKSKEHFGHLKYAWDPVSPIESGGYASCEDETLLDEEHHDKVKNYSFKPPIEVDLRHASEYVINDYKRDPMYRVEGSKATCIKGISAEDLFEIKWPQIIEDYKLEGKELVNVVE